MKKSVLVAVLIALAASLGCKTAPAPSVAASIVTPTGVPVSSMFSVDFQGISTHVYVDANTRRAVLIAGDMGRHHTGILGVFAPADATARRALITSLRDATGKIPRCNQDQCFVMISGASMRIRGNGQPPTGTQTIHPSFPCLVPQLSKHPINGGAILPAMSAAAPPGSRAHLPSAPAVGFFELENGTLTASRFETTGYFKDAAFLACNGDAEPPKTECVERAHCREFASGVRWEGETNGPARLQIASNHTAWQWEDIEIANGGPLMLYVENLANSGHASSAHFSLNAKLVTNKALPEIGLGCGAPDHAPCPLGPGPEAILAVPGCSDNQWP